MRHDEWLRDASEAEREEMFTVLAQAKVDAMRDHVKVVEGQPSSPDWYFNTGLSLLMNWKDGLVVLGGGATFLVLAGFLAGRLVAG